MTERSPRRISHDFFRLLLLVLVGLPVAVLLVGPALVFSSLVGPLQLGPVVLSSEGRGIKGRGVALITGLILWVMIWGALYLLVSAWVRPVLLSTQPEPTLSAAIAGSTATPVRAVSPSPTDSALPTSTLSPTAGLSPQPQATEEAAATRIQAVSPSATASPEPEVAATVAASPIGADTPSPLPTIDATQAGVSPTAVPTWTPVPAAPTATSQAFPSPLPTFTLPAPLAAEAISTVEQANELLRIAVTDPNSQNLESLEQLWKDNALEKAQEFARGPSLMVKQPLTVSYVYMVPPSVDRVEIGVRSDILLVNSIEIWTYEGAADSHSEGFRFVYTLSKESDGWVITDYTYLEAP